jgi:ubiquinone/menaquinone biosynthesis C-methylase UbiE
MSLLPDSQNEFRSKAYWDDFFLKRQNEAFEWYGDYSEIAQLLSSTVAKTDRVLIIGCGNSNFSLDFYERGYTHLVNLDFSERVIEEMRGKSELRGMDMEWTVGDMTDLGQYDDASFDVVFDKGALDALMSADTPETRQKAGCMFGEIDRVVGVGGRYVCITLAEQFIVETLLDHYCPSAGGAGGGGVGSASAPACAYSVTVDAVPAKRDSPFVPFYVNIKKTKNIQNIHTHSNKNIHMQSNKTHSNSSVEIFLDQFGAPLASGSVVEGVTGEAAVAHLCGVQEFQQKHYKIGRFEANRFEKMQFFSYGEHADIPRFTIFVLDFAPAATLSVAVFMVPIGRESGMYHNNRHIYTPYTAYTH